MMLGFVLIVVGIALMCLHNTEKTIERLEAVALLRDTLLSRCRNIVTYADLPELSLSEAEKCIYG